MKHSFGIISALIIILLIVYMYSGINSSQKNTDEENLKVLSDAITRSCVQCYALEGFYPPDIKYMEDKYGLMVNRDKYYVSYSVFASNILPEIVVIIK